LAEVVHIAPDIFDEALHLEMALVVKTRDARSFFYNEPKMGKFTK
jgi:hypothetical protein